MPVGEPGEAARKPVKVALILPLSGAGQAAVVAESMKQAALNVCASIGSSADSFAASPARRSVGSVAGIIVGPRLGRWT